MAATVFGIVPLVYGACVIGVGGVWGAFRAASIGEALTGVLLLIAGFAYLRASTRPPLVRRAIESVGTRRRRGFRRPRMNLHRRPRGNAAGGEGRERHLVIWDPAGQLPSVPLQQLGVARVITEVVPLGPS